MNMVFYFCPIIKNNFICKSGITCIPNQELQGNSYASQELLGIWNGSTNSIKDAESTWYIQASHHRVAFKNGIWHFFLSYYTHTLWSLSEDWTGEIVACDICKRTNSSQARQCNWLQMKRKKKSGIPISAIWKELDVSLKIFFSLIF